MSSEHSNNKGPRLFRIKRERQPDSDHARDEIDRARKNYMGIVSIHTTTLKRDIPVTVNIPQARPNEESTNFIVAERFLDQFYSQIQYDPIKGLDKRDIGWYTDMLLLRARAELTLERWWD